MLCHASRKVRPDLDSGDGPATSWSFRGSQVIVKVEPSGAIQITSRSQALAKAREEIRKYIPDGRDVVDELIEDRRKEAEEEERGASRS